MVGGGGFGFENVEGGPGHHRGEPEPQGRRSLRASGTSRPVTTGRANLSDLKTASHGVTVPSYRTNTYSINWITNIFIIIEFD
jgi:hypothetical protein